jgi:hypothetical protein
MRESARAKNMKMRSLMRVEFGLKDRLGDEDLAESGTNIFFLSDTPADANVLMTLKIPAEDAWPEQDMIFIEL